MRFFVAQIPHEAIQASLRFDLLFRLLVVRIERFVEQLGFGTRILANHFPEASRISSFVSVPAFGASFR